MTRTISNLKFQIALVALMASTAFGGLRIDLRPAQVTFNGGYQPGLTIPVDVFLVDTGNPQGDIFFRGVFLDTGDTTGSITFPGSDSVLGTDDDNQFEWLDPAGLGAVYPVLSRPSWVHALANPFPPAQISLPDGGERRIGTLNVMVGSSGGVLDLINNDNPDPNFGARVDFGFGGPGDPVTTWRAFNGDITGGVLELPVVPEPGSCLLLAAGMAALQFRRKFV